MSIDTETPNVATSVLTKMMNNVRNNVVVDENDEPEIAQKKTARKRLLKGGAAFAATVAIAAVAMKFIGNQEKTDEVNEEIESTD